MILWKIDAHLSK